MCLRSVAPWSTWGWTRHPTIRRSVKPIWQDVRREFAIPQKGALIGMMARVADQKDHHTFIKAAAKVAARNPNVFFLVIGEHSATPEMRRYYREDLVLAGRRSLTQALPDIHRLQARYAPVASRAGHFCSEYPSGRAAGSWLWK